MNHNSRPTKRQRKEQPPSWLENESLACVASPSGKALYTKVASVQDKDIFLDRLKKEIIRPFFDTTTKKKNNNTKKTSQKGIGNDDHPKHNNSTDPNQKPVNEMSKRRIVFGTNQCTRVLERSNTGTPPLLIVLARDIYPPTMLSHIPVMASNQHNPNQHSDIPILLLPGKASRELGKLFGTKHVSILLFLSKDDSSEVKESSMNNETETKTTGEDSITSFVHFCRHAFL